METRLPKLKVLVVEDEETTRLLIRALLRRMEVSAIIEFDNGTDAKHLLSAPSPLINLVICDWGLPDVPGIDLLKLVRLSHPRLPFLMLTARKDVDSVREAKLNHVSAYLAKPVSPAELQRKIRTIAGERV